MNPFNYLSLALLLLQGAFNQDLLAQETQGATVTIVLENVLSDDGIILAALHQEATFMKGPGVDNFKSAAQKGVMTIRFSNVAPGTYAFSVLHDLNGNNRMDFESNGMPKEPYGMSGNDMAMGPPTFDGCSFEVSAEPVNLKIRF